MHISEGVLSAPVLIGGAALSACGVAVGLKKVEERELPRVAVLSSVFFVASLIRVPAGPASVHLVTNGLAGIFLGWAAFPAILVALVLQAVLFQFGGLTTLGVNTFNMAAPAVACFYLFRGPVRSPSAWVSSTASFACGFSAVMMGCLLIAVSLVFTEEAFLRTAQAAVVFHLPVMVVVGTITALCVRFVRKIRPEMLDVRSGGG
ncbi:MAG: cobalt transporter CbiM [bacterium]